MIGHYFQFDDFRFKFCSNLMQDFYQPTIHTLYQNETTVFRTPDNMVLARIDNVSIALVPNICSHADIIQQTAI
jgi:hypothetical protein